MNKKIFLFTFLAILLVINVLSLQETESDIYIITIDYHNQDAKILSIELSKGYYPNIGSDEWSACVINKNSEKSCTNFRDPSLLLTDGKDKQDNMLGSQEKISETVIRIITPYLKDAEKLTISHKTPEKTEEITSIDVKNIQLSPSKPLFSMRKKLPFFSLSSFILASLIIAFFYIITLNKE